MPDLWMPGATRLDIGDHQPTDGGPAKAIPHITWDKNATAVKPLALVSYETLVDYFGRNSAGKAVAPHLLWDPFGGCFTQFVPANCRSKSLADAPGGTRTNRAGSVVIQIEALFFPYCMVDGKVYPRLVDTPCKGWPELHAWLKSWGIPDVWPNGRPENCTRNETNWETKAGYYPHAAVPENDHQDPLSWPAFPAQQEDDMTPDESRMLKELYDGRRVLPWTYKGQAQPDRDAFNFLVTTDSNAKKALDGVVGLGAKVDALKPDLSPADVQAIADRLAAAPALAEAIAEQVAAKLAARLAE